MPAEVQVASTGWIKRILIGRDPQRTLARIVIWVALCLLLKSFVLLPIKVEGPSMMPTYKEGRVNCVNRVAYLFHEPRRGDVVAIKVAGDHAMYLKRIIGLPGESVEFHRGHVFINGERLDEPYLKYSCDWEQPPIKIGPGEYYVVGDNRSMDFGDHTQGKAWRSQILGKILL